MGIGFHLVLMSLTMPVGAATDIVGPSRARAAVSPDGNRVVRRTAVESKQVPPPPLVHVMAQHRFDGKTDGFVKQFEVRLTDYLAQFLFVSDAGHVVMVSLTPKNSLRLYSEDGKLQKSWNLDEILSKAEIEACGQTGSTIQWFEEGSVSPHGESFYFRGPSTRLRALGPSYTIMRGADEKVGFSRQLDLKASALTKVE